MNLLAPPPGEPFMDGQGGPAESWAVADHGGASDPLAGLRGSDQPGTEDWRLPEDGADARHKSAGAAAVSRPAGVEGPDLESDPVSEALLPAEADTFFIGRHETFYDALRRRGAPHGDIMGLVDACGKYRNLKRVRRGDAFRIVQAADGGIRTLSFDLDEESYLIFTREGDEYTVSEATHPVWRRTCGVSGTIESSLYASLQAAGAPLSLAAKMNDILGWEIDFQRDLRPGDTYRILYEEVWRQDRYVRTGPILALECVNRGRVHRACRFMTGENGPGYFTPEGGNLQKQLMRAPLEYSRISSGFSLRRLHPVLKRYMPHKGVDYAAPVGTPVWAAGDGTVVEMSSKKGNGRYLRIQHTNRAYETYYLHLSRYARGIRKGGHVKQGQVIGYVGASGYATGPHLDFRVRKDGRFVDPRRLKLPPAEPVPAQDQEDFATLAALYMGSLDALALDSPPHQVALAQTTRPPLWQPPTEVSVLRRDAFAGSAP